jgi:hypothetical protein
MNFRISSQLASHRLRDERLAFAVAVAVERFGVGVGVLRSEVRGAFGLVLFASD